MVYTNLLGTFLTVSNYPAVSYLSSFKKALYKLCIVYIAVLKVNLFNRRTKDLVNSFTFSRLINISNYSLKI
jgi:hypothetical protein